MLSRHGYKGWVGYSLPGVLGAPPLVSQFAILATSSIPCPFGFPSSLVSPNSFACWRSQVSIACLTDFPRRRSRFSETASHALIAAANFAE
jgi:hypothetical protein